MHSISLDDLGTIIECIQKFLVFQSIIVLFIIKRKIPTHMANGLHRVRQNDMFRLELSQNQYLSN